MDNEQFDRFLESNERATGEAIEKFVNGKIRAIDQKLTDHMRNEEEKWEEIKPYIEGAAGLKMLQKFLLWVGGAVLAWTAIKNNIRL